MNIFDETQNLFETSEEAFEAYRILKAMQLNSKDGIILCLHRNKKEAEKHYKISKAKLGKHARYNNNNLEIIFADTIRRFASIKEINKLAGLRAQQIRFYN